MPLNIKNPMVERLVDQLATLTGESKTETVRRALEERLQRLVYRRRPTERAGRLQRFLEGELWPAVPKSQLGRALSREEEEDILGVGEDGT